MRREIPSLRRAPSLRGGKTKTRGFGRDDVMGEMASWRVLSAAAVRRATTNKRYGVGETPAVRKPTARGGESVMLLASSRLRLLRTVAQARLPVLLKVKELAGGQRYEKQKRSGGGGTKSGSGGWKRQRRLETAAAVGNGSGGNEPRRLARMSPSFVRARQRSSRLRVNKRCRMEFVRSRMGQRTGSFIRGAAMR
jgi:hypothetical protein